jgi:hypothetical protein
MPIAYHGFWRETTVELGTGEMNRSRYFTEEQAGRALWDKLSTTDLKTNERV